MRHGVNYIVNFTLKTDKRKIWWLWFETLSFWGDYMIESLKWVKLSNIQTYGVSFPETELKEDVCSCNQHFGKKSYLILAMLHVFQFLSKKLLNNCLMGDSVNI